MNIKRIIPAFCLLLILMNPSLKAETNPGFKRCQINTEDPIDDVFFRDINHDDLKDLFLTTSDPSKKDPRKLMIYLQNKAGFPNRADTVITFPEDAVVYDVGNLPERSDGPAIIYVSEKGLFYFACERGTYNTPPQMLSSISSVFLVPARKGTIRARLFHTTDRPHPNVICLTGHTSLRIIDPSKSDGFENPFLLPLSVMTSFESGSDGSSKGQQSLSQSQRLVILIPELFFERFDHDQTKDLIAVVKDRITVFKGIKNGFFQEEPIFRSTLNLSNQSDSGLMKPNFVVHIADANGDGQQDILVTNASMSSKKTSTKVYLFINRDGVLPFSPDEVILFANTLGNNMEFKDMNGDGSVDLVIPSANINLFQFVKILLSQKMNYTKNIHLWQKGGYPRSPDVQLKGQLRFNLENVDDLKGIFFYLDGDVNGDGVKDLLKSDSDKGKITIRLGQKDSSHLFHQHYFAQLKEIYIPSEIELQDINNDRYDEIIYRQGVKDPKSLIIWITEKH